ncbi:MAG: hypothetical protein WBF45_08355 [Acidobacteriaceae bacterium]
MNISEWEPSFYCSSHCMVEKLAGTTEFTDSVSRIRQDLSHFAQLT